MYAFKRWKYGPPADNGNGDGDLPKARLSGLRSRNGCLTCRIRKQKCDENRPTCSTCHQMNLHCRGYERQLMWVDAIASRGKFAGATKPVLGKETTKGSKCKKAPEQVRASDSKPLDLSFTNPREIVDGILFREFQEWGYLSLNSEADPEQNVFLLHVVPLARDSNILISAFLTYQTTLNSTYGHMFGEYYADTLRMFRDALNDPVEIAKEETLLCGLHLCSIGMNRRLPWTIHLDGLYTILKVQYLLEQPTEFVTNFVDLIGWLDQTAFIVGRQTPSLHIWRQHCLDLPALQLHSQDDSALPRSLQNLFSQIENPDIQTMFWNWRGPVKDHVQQKLCDAFRFAGIISARESLASNPEAKKSQPSVVAIINTETLVGEILAAIDTIRVAIREDSSTKSSRYSCYLYPLFIAGSQAKFVDLSRMNFIENAFEELIHQKVHMGKDPYYEAPLLVLRKVWAGEGTVEQITRSLNWEVGLFE